MNQISMSTMDRNHVDARLDRPRRRGAKGLDDLPDILLAHFFGCAVVVVPRLGTRRLDLVHEAAIAVRHGFEAQPRRTHIGLAPSMLQLDGDALRLRVHHVDHALQGCDLVV